MALADVFYVLTILFLGMLLLVPFMRRPSAANAGGAGH
jgi:DHA2 family multidrug resistance protein